MDNSYNFTELENKWQKKWEEEEIYKTENTEDSEKYYVLEMFPYPSGDLHMGHVRVYSIGDVIARYWSMKQYDVLHPMGWDAFGLPAENAAIKHGNIHPREWTWDNISRMKKQLKRLGLSYDWDREVTTADPDYYRWTQWFFLQMFKHDLAYRDESPVNWCPGCETVLANEQVIDNACERCDSEVEERELEQWFFKITDYAERLLQDHELLDWPERVKEMQKNWIGKSEGTIINFPVRGRNKNLEVFTTRPDTIYGATFMALAPEHPLVEELAASSEKEEEIYEFVERAKKRKKEERTSPESEKNGIFTGSYALNPMTGRDIPILIADFVLMSYGTGAIMSVPAHDQRDYDFAQKYDLPIRVVIQPEDREEKLTTEELDEAYEESGVLINSEKFNGLTTEKAVAEIAEEMEKRDIGYRETNYSLRDWLISRQRYWGAPIPVVYCDKCGIVPVPEEELPVELPHDVEFTPDGESPLGKVEDFVNTSCPECGHPAHRETDTMDTFVDSSWYFLRYIDPHNEELPFSPEKAEDWFPVDQYVGGIEHAILHLLYARYFTKVVYDMDMILDSEPFSNLLPQGMVLKDGAKMSKSRGNVVDPENIMAEYGADTARLFILFASPPEKDLEWDDEGVAGAERFLNRIWRLVNENIEFLNDVSTADLEVQSLEGPGKDLYRKLHETIKKVSADIGQRQTLNTAISAIMELYNEVSSYLQNTGKQELNYPLVKMTVKKTLLLLAPFAPHITEELWDRMNQKGSIHNQEWPDYSEQALQRDEVTVVIQINGKVRDKIQVRPGLGEDELIEKAKKRDQVQKYVSEKEIIKTIVVPDKLINLVVK